MAVHVLSVGQCSADNWRLARFLKESVQATMEEAYSGEDALRRLEKGAYDLVLVNRIFDSSGEEGVDFIAEAKRAGAKAPLMLVSDYEDAQARAVANGALPGFGKSSLEEGEPLVRAAVESAQKK